MLKTLSVLLLVFSLRPMIGCTGLLASGRGMVLAGNNEDYVLPQTKVWFVPGAKGAYGRVYVGFSDLFPQGGMNEKGLFFDGFAIREPLPATTSTGKERFGPDSMQKLMSECATVDDVIRFLSRYDTDLFGGGVLMFADAAGDSAVIDGHGAIRKKGWYQVQTNFRQWQVKTGEIACERYKVATGMLEKSGGAISVDLFRRILAATHVEHPVATLYSNIYDLKNQVMYLYHFHNFENVVKFDLHGELKKGSRVYDLPALFPKTVAAENFAREKARPGAPAGLRND